MFPYPDLYLVSDSCSLLYALPYSFGDVLSYIYSMSNMWYACLGTCLTLFIGCIVSICTLYWEHPSVDPKLLSPPVAVSPLDCEHHGR